MTRPIATLCNGKRKGAGVEEDEAEAAVRPPTFATWWRRYRRSAARLMIELFVVFIGATAAFALDGWRSDRAEASYRRQMIDSLVVQIEGLAVRNRQIQALMNNQIAQFDAALARGERPAPPIYREPGGERAPTGGWDGIVATGAARALPADLYFRLTEFFNRVDSWGDKYARYNAFTEDRVMPNLTGNTDAFYTPEGKLRGEYRAYVDRLRDIAKLGGETTVQGRDLLRDVRAANRAD